MVIFDVLRAYFSPTRSNETSFNFVKNDKEDRIKMAQEKLPFSIFTLSEYVMERSAVSPNCVKKYKNWFRIAETIAM